MIPGQRVIDILILHGFEGTEFCVGGVQTFPGAPQEVVTFHPDQHLMGAAVIHVVNRVQRQAQRDPDDPGQS